MDFFCELCLLCPAYRICYDKIILYLVKDTHSQKIFDLLNIIFGNMYTKSLKDF